jgi:hypothetical protein
MENKIEIISNNRINLKTRFTIEFKFIDNFINL